MKKVLMLMVVLLLVLAGASSGKDSPKGGNVAVGEGFKIDVPTFAVKVKQGEIQAINIKLQRGESFKQDVMLELQTADDISITPDKILVKASDKSEVQFTIEVPKDAAIGKYIVSVTGTPETGEPTSVEFKVNVVSTETNYALQSDSPQGGGVGEDEDFKISVPYFSTKITQGKVQTVKISLDRGESFKQDVTLKIKAAKGIKVEPTEAVVLISDKSDVQIKITVPEGAAIGDYIVSVKGTPKTGEPTSVGFKVKVVAP